LCSPVIKSLQRYKNNLLCPLNALAKNFTLFVLSQKPVVKELIQASLYRLAALCLLPVMDLPLNLIIYNAISMPKYVKIINYLITT